MAKMPVHIEALADLIYESYEKANTKGLYLSRIGASGIGEECTRAVWFDWRGFSDDKPSGRLLRLFKTGFIQEDRMLEDLKNAGLEVWGYDENGDQWTYTAANGHFVCKLDGVVRGVPGAEKTVHTLEIKTSALKGFKEMQSQGLQRSKPFHYAQMQTGMHCSGIHRGLYIMICKDDEKLYIERISLDEKVVKELFDRVETVISASIPPTRIADKPDDWRCKFCDNKGVCWEGKTPLRHCRTCEHSSAIENGAWMCGLLNTELDMTAQLKGCEYYSVILK